MTAVLLVELLRRFAQLGSRWQLSHNVPRLNEVTHEELTPRPVPASARQRRLTSDEIDQLIESYRAGASMSALAQRWGVHRITVASHLRRAGATVRRPGIAPDDLPLAIKLYADGWSLQRLGERFGCDAETVRTAFRNAGVQRREPWERRV